jgi:mRNA turnover protein 4
MRHFSDPPEPFPHNEESQLRKLGLSTSMVRGVPTLTVAHEVCKKGKALTSEQAQLLKLTGVKMVMFRVGLLARWESATGGAEQIVGGGFAVEDEADGAATDMT